MKSDRELERDRYEERAKAALAANPEFADTKALTVLPPALRAPYLYYRAEVEQSITDPKMTILEIGAGTGLFTEFALQTGARTIATDISTSSLKLLQQRLPGYDNLEIWGADMECLPFADGIFDVVLSAGSLSYGDNLTVRNEIYRVLKRGGRFICVDSLNHNPIYRLNRWIQYCRGRRTRSTLERMPTLRLIQAYAERFKVKTRFFGSISWLAPVLGLFVAAETVARYCDKVDVDFDISKSAFKFVMLAEKAGV